jgi:hypothetical protein
MENRSSVTLLLASIEYRIIFQMPTSTLLLQYLIVLLSIRLAAMYARSLHMQHPFSCFGGFPAFRTTLLRVLMYSYPIPSDGNGGVGACAAGS